MTTTPLADWERGLADRLVARDHGALAELYDRFAPYVFGLAQRVSRDRHAAEDVTQEVFLGVWQSPGRFDPARGSMRAWLGTITHRAAVAWVRRQVSVRRRESSDGLPTVAADDVEETALRLVIAERARRVVAALPEAKRRAVEMAYFDSLTYRQVAKRTGVPEGTAKSRIRHALRAIASALETEVAEGMT